MSINHFIETECSAVVDQIMPHVNDETRAIILGGNVHAMFKSGSGKTLVRLCILSDVLRILTDAIYADDEVSAEEVELVLPFIAKAATELGNYRNIYTAYAGLSEAHLPRFLDTYRSDQQEFGHACSRTSWAGLEICCNLARSFSEHEPLTSFVSFAQNLTTMVLHVDGTTDAEERYYKDFVDKIMLKLYDVDSQSVDVIGFLQRSISVEKFSQPELQSQDLISVAIDKPVEHVSPETDLIQFGTSEAVSVRIRNVFEKLEPDSPLQGMTLATAAKEFLFVTDYLLEIRNFGETCVTELREAISKVLSQVNDVDEPPPTHDYDLPLVQFVLRRVTNNRLKNVFSKLPANHTFHNMTVLEASRNWHLLEEAFNQLSSIGETSAQTLHDALQAATADAPHDQTPGTGKSEAETEALKQSLLQHPLANASCEWFLKAFMPTDLYEEIPQETKSTSLFDIANAFSNMPAIDIKKTVYHIAISSHAPVRVRNACEHLSPDEPLLKILPREALDRWVEFKSWLKTQAAVGDNTLEKFQHLLSQRSQEPESIEATAKHFLQQSASWFCTLPSGVIGLTSEGRSHMLIWAANAESRMTNEWLCVSYLCSQLGVNKSIAALQLSGCKYSDEERRKKLPKLHITMAIGKNLHDKNFRADICKHDILRGYITHATNELLAADENLNHEDLFEFLLHGLEPKKRSIIICRHCCDEQGRITTLDVLGQRNQLTRERIRQLEKQWKESVDKDGRADLAKQMLETHESAWHDTFVQKVLDSDDESTVTSPRALVPDSVQLIFAAAGENIQDWIDIYSVDVDETINISVDPEERHLIQEAEQYLESLLARPNALPQLIKQLDQPPSQFEDTVHLTSHVREGKISVLPTREGVVVAASDNVKQQWLADTLSVFEEHHDWILSDQQLWNMIRKTTDDIKPSSWGTFTKSITSGSHRFRHIPRIGWWDLVDCEISREDPRVGRPLIAPATAMGPSTDSISTKSNRRTLYQLIASRGCVTATQGNALWKETAGGSGGSFSLLLKNPFFITAHPKYHACLTDDGKLAGTDEIRDTLNSRETLGEYLKLRRAGMIPLDFPAWDQPMLEMWRDWSKSNTPDETAEGICRQLDYDLSTFDTIKEGYQCQKINAGDSLGLSESLRRPVDCKIPQLEKLFILLATATRFGYLNYFLVNCCVKSKKAYGHSSCSWLAFMCAAGLLKTPSHWQDPHPITEEGSNLLYDLISIAKEHSEINWNTTPLGQDLIIKAADSWKSNLRNGWVSHSQFMRLLKGMLDPYTLDKRDNNFNKKTFSFTDAHKELPARSANPPMHVDWLEDLLKRRRGA